MAVVLSYYTTRSQCALCCWCVQRQGQLTGTAAAQYRAQSMWPLPGAGSAFSPEPRRPRHRPLAEDEEIQRRIAEASAQVSKGGGRHAVHDMCESLEAAAALISNAD